MGRKAITGFLLAFAIIVGCEKKKEPYFYGKYHFQTLLVNNQNYIDSLHYYYPNLKIDFYTIKASYTLAIVFADKPCDECYFVYRGSYYYPLEDNIFNLKTPLWVRNTNRDSNGWYVCDTCSYLKSLYGYDWGIRWDNPETIQFYAIAKDTLLLEIAASK
jgi:hypothetical protein